MLERVGRMVKVFDTMIPAVNIQVEDVPGFVDEGEHPVRWYGVYFEILFESGERWEVTQQSEQSDPANVVNVELHHPEGTPWPYVTHLGFPDWGSFLSWYKARSEAIHNGGAHGLQQL